MGGTTSSEQQAHDDLVTGQDKQAAFKAFGEKLLKEDPGKQQQLLSAINLKTNRKTCTTILNYLGTCTEQKNFRHVPAILIVLQLLLHVESFYRDLSRLPSLENIVKVLTTLKENDDCVLHVMKALELMASAQLFNRNVAAGPCGSAGAQGPADTPPTSNKPYAEIKTSRNDPRIATYESQMKAVLCSPGTQLPQALHALFTHHMAFYQPHTSFTDQQHQIMQSLLRLFRSFLSDQQNLNTSTYPQVVAFLELFKNDISDILKLTIELNPVTRLEATKLLIQLLIHHNTKITAEIQDMCLNQGYLLWYIYIALHKKGIHDDAHDMFDVKGHHVEYAELISCLVDRNDKIKRLLCRIIPKCLTDNSRAGRKAMQFDNFRKQTYLYGCPANVVADWKATTFYAYYEKTLMHDDWESVFGEIDDNHSNPLIVWNQDDKSELIEILLNENCDYNLQLDLSPNSKWDHEGFEADYTSQQQYLVVNRYYLHLLLPHYEATEPKDNQEQNKKANNNRAAAAANGGTSDEGNGTRPVAGKSRQIGTRGTLIDQSEGVFVPTRFRSEAADPLVVPVVEAGAFMAACFQRAVVEDDVGWKLACLRMMSTLYVHNTRVLSEINMMPYLIWLLTPKTETGTLFQVSTAMQVNKNLLGGQDDSDDEDNNNNANGGNNNNASVIGGLPVNTDMLRLKPPSSGTALVSATPSSASSSGRGALGGATPIHRGLSASQTPRNRGEARRLSSGPGNHEQSHLDPNATCSKAEQQLENDISMTLRSSFNNPLWRDQILKFLNILFDNPVNINKFVAGHGVNTLLYFINNCHRECHSEGLSDIKRLREQMEAQQQLAAQKAEAKLAAASSSSQYKNNNNNNNNNCHVSSIAEDDPSDSPKNQRYKRLSVNVGQQPSLQQPPTNLAPSNSSNHGNNTEKGGPLQRVVSRGRMRHDSDSDDESRTKAGSSKAAQYRLQSVGVDGPQPTSTGIGGDDYVSPYDPTVSPHLALLDTILHKAARANESFKTALRGKRCDLLQGVKSPDGIKEVAKRSLQLLSKIVHNAPRLNKKIFKPRVLTSLVQIVLIDDVEMVDTALDILMTLIEANTHIIPNLAKTGIFWFLLYAMRYNKIATPTMTAFIQNYHTKQNVHYLTRGQSIYTGLFPEPLINLSLQPNGGELLCATLNKSNTVRHRLLWDYTHKEIMSKYIINHLAPFIEKLVNYPFSTYVYPFDGQNYYNFKIPPLSITYPSIAAELYVGGIYVRFFNLECLRLNKNVLVDGKVHHIESTSKDTFFLQALLRELSTNNKYYTTRQLTLFDSFNFLHYIQPTATANNNNNKSMTSSSPDQQQQQQQQNDGLFFQPRDVEVITPSFPPIMQQQPYQALWEHTQRTHGRRSMVGSLSPGMGPHDLNSVSQDDASFKLVSHNNLPANPSNGSMMALSTTTSVNTAAEIAHAQHHLSELLQATAILIPQFPQDEDVVAFKYTSHIVSLLASVEAPYTASNVILRPLVHIIRSLLTVKNSNNAQTFVAHGMLRVLLRLTVVVGKHILSTTDDSTSKTYGFEYGAIRPVSTDNNNSSNNNSSGSNYGNNTTDEDLEKIKTHNDNVDLFTQLLQILTTLMLNGRSSHKPLTFYYQVSMMMFDVKHATDFFSLIQSVLTIDTQYQQPRMYLLSVTFRLLQSLSYYDHALHQFQVENVRFLQDRLHTAYDNAEEATSFFAELMDANNNTNSNNDNNNNNNNQQQPQSQEPIILPPLTPALEITKPHTPHHYILQFGLILDAIKYMLLQSDDHMLNVHAVGAVVDSESVKKAYLDQTPTKNSHTPTLKSLYPSHCMVFPASLYFDNVEYIIGDGTTRSITNLNSPTALSSAAPAAARAGTAGALAPTRPVLARSKSNGLEKNKKGSAREILALPPTTTQQQKGDKDDTAQYKMDNGGLHRGTLLGAVGSTVATTQNGGAGSSALLLPPALDINAEDVGSIGGSADNDAIATMNDAIRYQKTAVPFTPVTQQHLQHERSIAIRKEAVVFLTLLLSQYLPPLQTTPSTFQSNTFITNTILSDDGTTTSSTSSSSTSLLSNGVGSGKLVYSLIGGNNMLNDVDAAPSTASARHQRSIRPLNDSHKVDFWLFTIAQQLLTPGALFQLSKFQPHARYFLQSTADYAADKTLLSMINPHVYVPKAYDEFVKAIDNNHLFTPTYIWNATLRQETINIIKQIRDENNNNNNNNNNNKTITSTASHTTKIASSSVNTNNVNVVPFPKPWQWAQELFDFIQKQNNNRDNMDYSQQKATTPTKVLSFPWMLSILKKEIVVQGVYLRLWYHQASSCGSDIQAMATLLPPPLSSTSLFNQICLTLQIYALNAPKYCPNNALNNCNNNNNTQQQTQQKLLTTFSSLLPTSAAKSNPLLDFDLFATLDLGYMTKKTSPKGNDQDEQEQQTLLKHGDILLDDSSAIDITTPIAAQLYNSTSFTVTDKSTFDETDQYSAILPSPTQAVNDVNKVYIKYLENIKLFSMTLLQLAADPKCDMKSLTAPLTCAPASLIEGSKHDPKSYNLIGLYKFLSLLASEHSHPATINIVCIVLYILQRDIVHNQDIRPDFIKSIDFKSKQYQMPQFSQIQEVVISCCQYLLYLLLVPYQAVDPSYTDKLTSPVPSNEGNNNISNNTSNNNNSLTPQQQRLSLLGGKAPVSPRRDSVLNSNPFVKRDDTLSPQRNGNSNDNISNSHPSDHASSLLPQQSSSTRPHMLLILNILYNLVLSQTLLKKGKVIEILYKNGIISALLNIVFRPVNLVKQATNAKYCREVVNVFKATTTTTNVDNSNWLLSSVVPMHALFLPDQQHRAFVAEELGTTNLPSAQSSVYSSQSEHSRPEELLTIDYYPYSYDIDATPAVRRTSPLPMPLSIPEEYQYNTPIVTNDDSMSKPTGTSSTQYQQHQQRIANTNAAKNNNKSSSSTTNTADTLISNHPYNVTYNTYTTAQRLLAAKIIGILFIHPVASPYFRNSLKVILSPQFTTNLFHASYNPLRFLSQLYTECLTPAFVWGTIAREEAQGFIHQECQHLLYQQIQLNRFYAQFLYLHRAKMLLQQEESAYAIKARSDREGEDTIEAAVDEMEVKHYKEVQQHFTLHYQMLYKLQVAKYQTQIIHPSASTSTNNKLTVGSSAINNSTTSSWQQQRASSVVANKTTNASSSVVTANGLPILTQNEINTIFNNTYADPLNAYYGIFPYDQAPSLYNEEHDGDGDQDDDVLREAPKFKTNVFQGTLTLVEPCTSADSLAERFPRVYLTHQVYINIDDVQGLGVYLFPLLQNSKHLSFDIKNKDIFMQALVQSTVSQMHKVTFAKNYAREAEKIYQECVEDGYIVVDEETGVSAIQPFDEIVRIRTNQLQRIHEQEREKQRQAAEQRRQQEKMQARKLQQDQPTAAARRQSAYSKTSSQSLQPMGSKDTSTTATPPPSTTTTAKSATPNDPPSSSTSANAGHHGHGSSPNINDLVILEDETYDDITESGAYGGAGTRYFADPLDSPDFIKNTYSKEALYNQVMNSLVTRTMIFSLYYNIPIETTLLLRMLEAVQLYIRLDPALTDNIRLSDFIFGPGHEEKLAKMAEFVLLECAGDDLTFNVDEELALQAEYWENIAERKERGEVISEKEQQYPTYPAIPQYFKDFQTTTPLAPLYDAESGANNLTLKCVQILTSVNNIPPTITVNRVTKKKTDGSEMAPHPSLDLPRISLRQEYLQTMHKLRISRWLLPLLHLQHDRFILTDPETGESAPATQPNILKPILELLYNIITAYPEHIADLINMAGIMYYLNLILQKQYLEEDTYKLALKTLSAFARHQVGQDATRCRLEVLNFMLCSFAEGLLADNTKEENLLELDGILNEIIPCCPCCCRGWTAETKGQLLNNLFKQRLPELTVIVMNYAPERGRIYDFSVIQHAVPSFEPFSEDAMDYICGIQVERPVIAAAPIATLTPPPTTPQITSPPSQQQQPSPGVENAEEFDIALPTAHLTETEESTAPNSLKDNNNNSSASATQQEKNVMVAE